MANIHGLGDFGQGYYGAIGDGAGNGNGGWQGPGYGLDQEAGVVGGHLPLTRRTMLPDLIDLFAPWFFIRSFTFFITCVEIAIFLVSMYVGQVYFDGALVKNNEMGGPSEETLLFMGAVSTPLIKNSYQFWRLITSLFLHAGILHITSNLLFFSQCAYTFERRWGRYSVILIFFISGIAGNMLSAIGNPDMTAVGASGALAGLLGADLVYIYLNWNFIPAREAHVELCVVCMIILLNAMIGGSKSNIDNLAHFGGLVEGGICGFSLVKILVPDQEPNKDAFRRGGVIGTVAVYSLFFIALYAFPSA
eukprot:CAMPEP_0170173342 /NCGR_PEP_ID=MMETSP0040_2-20121228/6615_1 /TAXON_ID=641309 /ORGANISM="Lotharella oceanica, Strain CCMP622" /LENGTH=305 /DNA_ID=CAMNT_0010414471 /DNA_START=14 /DNA_END=931 /DNA_ORIENTATION=-